MNAQNINSTADIYDLVEKLKIECRNNGLGDLATQLDGAMSLGSSGLEILGAIRKVFVENRTTIEHLLGPTGRERSGQVIAFVDKAFGR